MRQNISLIIEGLEQSRVEESATISGNIKDILANSSYLKNKEDFIEWVEHYFTDGEDNRDVDYCEIKSIKINKVENVIHKGYGVHDPKHPEYKELGGIPSYKISMKVDGDIYYDGDDKATKFSQDIVMHLTMKEWVGK